MAKLADDLGLSYWSLNDYVAEMQRTDSHMMVAIDADRVVGFIVGRRVPGSRNELAHDAEIYNIGVERGTQGLGIGNRLLASFVDKCRMEKVQEIWLDVRSNNTAAIGFYERAGFVAFAERRKFYTDPPDAGIVMLLDLAGEGK